MKNWKWKVIHTSVLLAIMIVACSATVWAGLEVSKENFPDDQFRAVISEFDKNKDGWLLPEEWDAVTEIDCKKNKNLKDVKGIENFEGLERLDCWGCPLAKLDISANKNLKYLDICETGLSTINLASNPRLRQLWAYGNKITGIDLSNCYYLSKAAKNKGKEVKMKGGLTALVYEDSDTGARLVVDKSVTITGTDKASQPTENDNSSDSGMGGFSSPQEGAVYLVGQSVPVEIHATGSISISGISVSGTCEIKKGSEVKYTKNISGANTSFTYVPDSVGEYSVSVRLTYFLSGNVVDTSSHKRTFTVVSSTTGQNSSTNTSSGPTADDLAHAEDSQTSTGSTQNTGNNNTTTGTNKTAAKSTQLIAKNKSYKVTKKVKKYTITLKSGKTPVKNVKVKLKVKGKTYTAKTNSKGKATFKIKNLKKKGKYTAVITFAGNKTYKKSTKKVKIQVKK